MSAALSEAELEAHIVRCGRLALTAQAAGDMVAERVWRQLQSTALRARSAALGRRDPEGCYFCKEGERARMQRANDVR